MWGKKFEYIYSKIILQKVREIKTFSDRQILREVIISIPALAKNLKQVFQEGKWYSSETCICIKEGRRSDME